MQASASLANAPDSVFRVWRNRLKIEYEAASLFGYLGEQLSALYGDSDVVVGLCKSAEKEELEHAQMCIEIINYSGNIVSFDYPRKEVQLGPEGMTVQQKILYSSLAMGCITETLSTALLTEMLSCAEKGLIKATVHRILKDEVKHSRIGWAVLNRQQRSQNLKWIQPYIPLMIQEALRGDIEPMLSQVEAKDDLCQWGILNPQQAQVIMQDTIAKVIRPGLSRFGLTC